MKACVPGVRTSCERGFPGSSQEVVPGAAIAIVAVLETTPPAFTITGTQQPGGAASGTVTTIWSMPAQHEARPALVGVAGTPPIETVTDGKLSDVGTDSS